ncbi:MAG: FecR domain-containing protein [Bacteroides sp.]
MNTTSHKIQIIAKQLRLFLQKQETEIPAPDKEKVLQAIKSKIARKQQQRKYQIYRYTALSLAASLLLLLGVSQLLKENTPLKDNLLEFAQRMDNGKAYAGEDIILQLADKEQIAVQKEEQVEYSADGTVQVNKKTIAQATDNSLQHAEQTYNQLIVPFGSRTQLRLSDGTNMWVNSGTRVVYPVVFSHATREIYVDGEVYLDVAHDASHPFIVKTDQFRVRVLGTAFNVSAYSKETTSSVVLVRGSVNVSNDTSKEVNLLPGQLTDIVGGVATPPQFTDVAKYTSWTDNQLFIDNIPLAQVFQKLHRYYGKEFVSSPQIDAIIATGKLELKKNLTEVMRAITFSVPVSFRESKDKIYLFYEERDIE